MATKKKLSKAQMRVAIAKDVIAALNTKHYAARSGSYISGTVALPKKKKPTVDIRPLLKKALKQCHVCAKGALFVSAVERYNNVSCSLYAGQTSISLFGRFNDEELISDHLIEYFTRRQIDLIETAFEGDNVTGNYEFGPDLFPAIHYVEEFPDAEARMIAIMKNIVKNKGTFKPRTDYPNIDPNEVVEVEVEEQLRHRNVLG